jgi:hypothetical protein
MNPVVSELNDHNALDTFFQSFGFGQNNNFGQFDLPFPAFGTPTDFDVFTMPLSEAIDVFTAGNWTTMAPLSQTVTLNDIVVQDETHVQSEPVTRSETVIPSETVVQSECHVLNEDVVLREGATGSENRRFDTVSSEETGIVVQGLNTSTPVPATLAPTEIKDRVQQPMNQVYQAVKNGEQSLHVRQLKC